MYYFHLALHFAIIDDDGAELFLGVASVEGGPGLFDVGQELHPLGDVFAELVAEGVGLEVPEGLVPQPLVHVAGHRLDGRVYHLVGFLHHLLAAGQLGQ